MNKILTNESKLFLGFIDKIKIYNKTNFRELLFVNDILYDNINLMQIINTDTILVVSYIDV